MQIKYRAVLPWTIFGRRVHPFSLAVCIALTTVFLYLGIWGEDATNLRVLQRMAVPRRRVRWRVADRAITPRVS